MSQSSPQQGAAYRPDIDGLRAVAILSVLVFHAFPSALPGGFIGVDVFFVISGYLISSILLKNLGEGRFSLWHFYRQRAKRIFPALSIVLLAAFALGWNIFTKDEFKQLGLHMLASAAFVQNFALWNEAGYFNVASELKPLMHLWSLAIEEQFYVVYPLLLWALWRYKFRRTAVLLVLALLSFAVNIYYTRHDVTSAFFMPHARFWELLAGGLLASVSTRPGSLSSLLGDKPAWMAHTASLGGLALIVLGLAFIHEDLAFPGWYALSPVAGACLLIAAGPKGWVNAVVLSSRPAVWIGLISYPLYLWHWPILSYLNIMENGQLLVTHRFVAMGLSIVLAWLTYRLLERPVRFTRDGALKVPALIMSMLLVGYLGYNTYHRDGLSFRATNKVVLNHFGELLASLDYVKPGCGWLEKDEGRLLDACLHDGRGMPRFALMGDSKARALMPGVMAMSTPEMPWLMMGGAGKHGVIMPMLASPPPYDAYLPLALKAVEAIEANAEIEVVVVTGATRGFYRLATEDSIEDLARSKNRQIALEGVSALVDRLVRAGKKVVLTVDNPSLSDPKLCIARQTGSEAIDRFFRASYAPRGCEIPYDLHRERAATYLDMLATVQRRHPDMVRVFDPTELMCDMESRTCGMYKDGALLYAYSDHISDHASQIVARHLLPFVAEFAGEKR